MNNKIKKYLLNAGWYKNRDVDISQCVKSFSKDNINLTPPSISFMKEYYNLKIKIIAEFEKMSGKIITIYINSHSCIDPELLNKYNEHYNKILIPVADCYDYAMIILIDECGKFYGASDQFISIIGNNFEEVLENMVNGVINTIEFKWDVIEDF